MRRDSLISIEESAVTLHYLNTVLERERAMWRDAVTATERYYDSLRVADDLRYQQLRDAQQTALDAALLAAKEAVQTALLAAKEAVIKAEVATENRLTLLNELRSGVATVQQLDAALERMADIKERVDRMEGERNLYVTSIQMADAMKPVNDFIAGRWGRAVGLKDYIGYIMLVVVILGLALAFFGKS